ncbi:hypothetical protein [Nocardia wallacei]|uniref:hypothetical protein n=1 Tax=Nocardia wallacei TaxID=480035 RepID=UPI0024556137|nr:hypothetical protein [Nocardia wallacei]
MGRREHREGSEVMTMSPGESRIDQSSPLPWPDGFGPESRRRVIVFATLPILILFTLIALVMTLAAIVSGNGQQALFGIAATLFLVATALIPVRIFRTRRTSAALTGQSRTGDTGLIVPAWRWFPLITTAWLVAGLVFAIPHVVIRLFEDYSTSGQAVRGYLGALALLLASALFVWLLARTLTAAKNGKRIILTPSGIELGDGHMRQIVEWKNVIEVAAVPQPRFATIRLPARPNSITIDKPDRWARKRKSAGVLVIYTLEFDIDSALVYHLIHFYWQHPEARDELTSDAVIERMRRGDLTG